ncbi:AAA family ATPase [Geobacter sulfurreducens]|uniref:AAA family ATPase n=1 Tax=Geobacter sulfurreducens TaxID=35554 RepID=UPI002B794373|nr:ATP-binding protein [Geobacter sulfurreducens]HML79881.1 ATP-binding protein [Geobacter sulfurreducens]
MPWTAQLNRDDDSAASVYAGGLDYLEDELRWLDCLIRYRIGDAPRRGGDPFGQLRGLVLSDDEINGLLSGDAGEPPRGSSELDDELAALAAGVTERRAATRRAGISLPLDNLSRTFNLSPFEEKCLLICLAPELDPKYEKFFAYLHDDVTRRLPTIGLILDLLCPSFPDRVAARTVFDLRAPLAKYRLVRFIQDSPDGPFPFPSRQLMLNERVAGFLLGHIHPDPLLVDSVRLVRLNPAERTTSENDPNLDRTRHLVHAHLTAQKSSERSLVLFCRGPRGAGKRELAEAVCRDLGLGLLVADVERMLAGSVPFGEMAWLLGREAALQPAVLCLEGMDALLAGEKDHSPELTSLMDAIRTFCRVTFVCSSRPWIPRNRRPSDFFIELDFPLPDEGARKRLWEQGLRGGTLAAGLGEAGALAGTFRFTPGQIRHALASAHDLAAWRGGVGEAGDGPSAADLLHAACRAQSHIRLGTLARRIEPVHTLDDIVLPAFQMAQLREICAQVRYRHLVFGQWGFDRKLSSGKGLTALFTGTPGTGKTMAAEVVARELGLELYRIDLSQVVSKYIGETEKNLERIFAEAETAGAILFFDEADALFGRRSEVKDAHDRYANIEIGYLLQRMEEYSGISILATNLRQNLDEAFTRRIRIVVEFPFPDEEYREMIWQRIFPPELPVGDDVDLGFLARRFRISGGDIRNVALGAVFYAAEEGRPLAMAHLVRALGRELRKTGKPCTREEFGDYLEMLA